MTSTVELNELHQYLSGFDYPIDRPTAIDRTRGTTLALADGEEDLGAVIEQSSADRFDSEDELETEVFNLLPRNAVGEPYQSEGEG